MGLCLSKVRTVGQLVRSGKGGGFRCAGCAGCLVCGAVDGVAGPGGAADHATGGAATCGAAGCATLLKGRELALAEEGRVGMSPLRGEIGRCSRAQPK